MSQSLNLNQFVENQSIKEWVINVFSIDLFKSKIISKEQTTLLEDAYEALELASEIARVSVVTTKTRMYTMPLLEHFNIAQFFEIVTGRENVQNPKPHPEPILITLEQMNYNKDIDTVWMIGDTKLDLIAAKQANVNSIGVLCGYGEKEELKEYTEYIKDNSLSAVRFIKSIS